MFADFITPQDDRWMRVLSRVKHDCYHLPEYVELAAAEEGAMPVAFCAEDGSDVCLIPLLIRPLPSVLNAPSDWVDCISPYGYPGIAISSLSRLHVFLEMFRYAASQRGIVTAFLRLHPLFPLDRAVLERFGQVRRHGQTVSIDLSETTEDIWRGVSPNHRRNITRLHQSGFRGSIDEWNRYLDFIEVYHSTMQRVGAASAYFFKPSYFEALKAKLGERLHLVSVMSDANELAAAGLFISTDGLVQYHLGGSAERHLHLAPTKLMIDFVWRWAKDQGSTVVHLGGGVGGMEDSLFRFKARFSPHRGEFFTYRVVLDEAKHAMLLRATGAMRVTNLIPALEFFPAYRDLQPSLANSEASGLPTFSGL